jgi:serine/threonine protein phosphatase 1
MEQRIYAIGDVHGYSGQLDRALNLVEEDGGPDAPIVFLGDLVDRGPDSRGVIDRLIRGIAAGKPWTVIKGNHDRMFERFVTDAAAGDDMVLSGKGWLHHRLGGNATLASYLDLPGFRHPEGGGIETLARIGLDPVPDDLLEQLARAACDQVPADHLAFLARLPLWHQVGELLFVHAGIRPGVPIEEQEEDDLLWIRNEFLLDPRDHGPLVVHGHTALDHPVAYPNRINLDGGAGYGRPLRPAVFTGRSCALLTEAGHLPLVPARAA